MRSLTSRLLSLALVLPTAVVAGLTTAPASAAAGDVLSIEWDTQMSSGTQVSQAADFTAYPPSSSTTASGAVFTMPSSLKKVTVAPPTRTLFAAGQTYAATPTATASTARLAFNGVYSTSLCPSSTVATTAASITVLDVAYDTNGVLTRLAADYKATCTLDTGTPETVSGSLRHGSSTSWLALTPAYTPDVVPVGKQRMHPVTITATGAGKTVTLGDATISGTRADDYRVSGNGCAGVVLGDGDSCRVDVVFAPLAVTGGTPNQRIATLAVATTRHVANPLKVRLVSTSTTVPAAPESLTTYPTSDGVGVTWEPGYPSAEEYRVERRLAGDTAWTPAATLPASDFYNYVDHDTAPGETVDYRVTGDNAGWDGPSATTSTTRPASVPSAGPNSLVWFGSADAASGDATISDGVDGGTVTSWGGQAPSIRATAGPTGTGLASSEVTYRVPFVPGPGEYRSADRTVGWIASSVDPNLGCTYVDSVLDVRSVAYDENRKPLVLDASWTGHCASGIVARIEIRLGVGTGHNRVTTDPAVVGRLTTYGGRTATGATTVTNHGPEDVTLGQASLRGDAAGDWTITGTTCTGVVLHADDTCSVALRFSSSADHERPAVLEVEQRDATGDLAPVHVPLDGYGATVPDPPYGFTSTTIGAVLLWTAEARFDGGLPITSYDVQRRAHGTTSWGPVTDAPGGPKLSYVDQSAVDGTVYDYRARAVNEVGPGAWNVLGSSNGAETSKRALVVSGSAGTTGPRGLFQLTRDSWQAPLIALTDDPQHDYRDPAASPAGTRLAVSVSTGDGSDGEYDLWAGTLAQPKTQRVTSMAGAERDASYSPDASSIAFTHVAADGGRSVWVVPALGGDPQLVRDHAAAPAWTVDGSGLVVEDDSTADAPLLTVDLTSGDATAVPGTAGGSEPTVSRTGAIAFVDASGRVLALAPGATTPTLAFNPRFGRTYGSPVYDDTGQVFYDATWTATGEPDFTNTYLLRVSGEPATVLQDRDAPWLTPVGLTDFVRGAASFDPQYGDSETPHPALHPQCRLDGAAWAPCSGPVSYPDLAEGEHQVDLRVTDEAGHTTTNHVKVVSDTVAPTVTVTAPGTRSSQVVGGTAAFSWDGHDAASGADWWDVEVRTASPTSGFTKWHLPKGWSSTDQYSSLQTPVKVAQELCLRVRVRDQSGLWSGYTTKCVGRPVDDASLTASAGWRRVRMSGLFQGTETTTSHQGAVLRTSSKVTTRRVGVLATTCPTCGAVKVYVGSRYVGTASLRADRTRDQKLVMLPLLPEKAAGRVKLVTTSGRVVRVDGLLLRRT